MIQRILNSIIDFFINPFAADFPDIYPPECFDCNLGGESCPDCEIRIEFEKDK